MTNLLLRISGRDIDLALAVTQGTGQHPLEGRAIAPGKIGDITGIDPEGISVVVCPSCRAIHSGFSPPPATRWQPYADIDRDDVP